jgi:hypothetical protein
MKNESKRELLSPCEDGQSDKWELAEDLSPGQLGELTSLLTLHLAGLLELWCSSPKLKI